MSAKQATDTRWNPAQYQKFSDHRLRPALELLNRIPLQAPEIIFDLGCGTGEVTRLIAGRWPSAKVFGLDSSVEMLEKARSGGGNVDWIEADVSTWKPDELPDLVYSNATLHWVEEHESLFPKLAGFLNPGGCLAVQMPLSFELPSHRLMRETLDEGGEGGGPLGTEALRMSVARKWVEDKDAYYDLLANRSRYLDIWETEYLQVLEGEDPVLEWVKATGLRPVLNGLEGAERDRFLESYRQRLRRAYPRRASGMTLYPFSRLFIVAMV
ncbi:MAG TPA: methyltransferase domain-containing protein [Gammaproteobacteria bacterium]|nr:methyltransferase domain-containing protein [Gammaproteobacteria bacterium]